MKILILLSALLSESALCADPCARAVVGRIAALISIPIDQQWEVDLAALRANPKSYQPKRLRWGNGIDWKQYFGKKVAVYEETGTLRLAPDVEFQTRIANNRPIRQIVQPDSANSANLQPTVLALRENSTGPNGEFVAEFGAIVLVTEKRVLKSQPLRGTLHEVPGELLAKATTDLMDQIPVGEKILEIHNLHTHPANTPLHASEAVLSFVQDNTPAFRELRRKYGGSEPTVNIWAVPYRSDFSFVYSENLAR